MSGDLVKNYARANFNARRKRLTKRFVFHAPGSRRSSARFSEHSQRGDPDRRRQTGGRHERETAHAAGPNYGRHGTGAARLELDGLASSGPNPNVQEHTDPRAECRRPRRVVQSAQPPCADVPELSAGRSHATVPPW
jgi:hypothetical protein